MLRSVLEDGWRKRRLGLSAAAGFIRCPGSTDVREVKQETPFGDPSDAYVLGTLEGRKVAFLARHGRGHRILPTELNFRANIYGFKQLGVRAHRLGVGRRIAQGRAQAA